MKKAEETKWETPTSEAAEMFAFSLWSKVYVLTAEDEIAEDDVVISCLSASGYSESV